MTKPRKFYKQDVPEFLRICGGYVFALVYFNSLSGKCVFAVSMPGKTLGLFVCKPRQLHLQGGIRVSGVSSVSVVSSVDSVSDPDEICLHDGVNYFFLTTDEIAFYEGMSSEMINQLDLEHYIARPVGLRDFSPLQNQEVQSVHYYGAISAHDQCLLRLESRRGKTGDHIYCAGVNSFAYHMDLAPASAIRAIMDSEIERFEAEAFIRGRYTSLAEQHLCGPSLTVRHQGNTVRVWANSFYHVKLNPLRFLKIPTLSLDDIENFFVDEQRELKLQHL